MPRMPSEEAQHYLSSVPEEYLFWCHDGQVLRNLMELKNAFEMMTDDTFSYHSNAEKSDFSTWVKDIIGDEKLARDLRKAADRTQAAKATSARSSFLESRI